MSINLDQARWVATLARLDLSDDDLVRMTGQISAILDYVDQLKQVPTDGVEPLAHPLDLHNVFRDDEPQSCLPAAEALANAPAKSADPATCGGFFLVPPVLD
jgi:aspartyl-tRNA(Asn)/glutamyl-tRNA(Gln) amidotransferase subunit C